MLWSHYHTLVTSDDMVTVTVTKKNVEGLGKITSYNMCNT